MRKASELVSITCNFNKLEQIFVAGEAIAGTIIIVPNYNLEFKSIRYDISYIIKSPSFLSQSRENHSEIIAVASKTWKKGVEYHYPFSKIIIQPTSYLGNLFDIEWRLNVYITFANSVKKITQQLELRDSDIKRVTFPSISLKKSFPFQILVGRRKRKTRALKHVFTHQKHIALFTILVGIGLLGLLFNWKEVIGLAIPVFEILGSVSFIFAVRHIILGFGKFDEFTFEVLPNQVGQSDFPVKFTADGKWNTIKYFSAYYRIFEKKGINVLSDAKVKRIYHMGHKLQKEVRGNETTLLIPFPQKADIPVSLTDKYVEIEWEMEATIQLNNGRKRKYKFKFLTSL